MSRQHTRTHDPNSRALIELLETLTFAQDKKMMKCFVIACVLALAAAQTPTRPVFADTFYASGDVELHVAEETRFGKCEFSLIARYVL